MSKTPAENGWYWWRQLGGGEAVFCAWPYPTGPWIVVQVIGDWVAVPGCSHGKYTLQDLVDKGEFGPHVPDMDIAGAGRRCGGCQHYQQECCPREFSGATTLRVMGTHRAAFACNRYEEAPE